MYAVDYTKATMTTSYRAEKTFKTEAAMEKWIERNEDNILVNAISFPEGK
jgi:hypothetical protein